LANLRQLGSCLQGHPSSLHAPFIACSTGSLGQGLSVGLGMALASRLKRGNHFIFVLTSDGEHNEGSIWEAAMAATHHRLGNLINIIDRNGMQVGGRTEEQIKEAQENFDESLCKFFLTNDIEELTRRKNNLNRRISTLKKAQRDLDKKIKERDENLLNGCLQVNGKCPVCESKDCLGCCPACGHKFSTEDSLGGCDGCIKEAEEEQESYYKTILIFQLITHI